MFIGHFGLGMAARRAAPRPSLGTLLLAAQFVDLLWPTMLLLGLEQVAIEPGATRMTPLHFVAYVHAQPAGRGGLGLPFWRRICLDAPRPPGRGRPGPAGGQPLGTGPARPPSGSAAVSRCPRVGLGLWNLPAVALPLELLLYVAGVWLYVAATRARDRTGRWAFWGLVVLLLLVHLSNLAGPPPSDPVTLAWFAQLQWLFIPWAYWIDAHRDNRP